VGGGGHSLRPVGRGQGDRLIYQLKEIRCTREAMALEAEAAAKKAPAVPSKVNVSIVTIPSGCFVSAERAEQIATGEFLRQVEHQTVSLDDHVRNAAAQAAAEREIDTAIDAAMFIEPVDPPEPAPAPEPDNPNLIMSASLRHKREAARAAALEAERRDVAWSRPRPSGSWYERHHPYSVD
jgi:hypothetical protein